MRESLIFPYLNGLEWATQLYKRGGWTMVSNAFTRLPLSTEQILHPEKYFNYERPVKVVLPDVANLLNAGSQQQTANSKQQTVNGKPESAISQPSAEDTQLSPVTAGVPPASFARVHLADNGPRNAGSEGILPASFAQASSRRPTRKSEPPTANRPLPTLAWRRIDSDVNGEWGYYLILDQFLNSPAESKRAVAGWAGDRYALYEGPGGRVFLAHVSAWDTENDAREFFEAYAKRTKLRYPGAEQLDPNLSEREAPGSKRETRNPEPGTRNIYSWTTSTGRVVIELRGLRVVILEGIPDGVESGVLLKTLQ